MASVLVDTNVLIRYFRGDEPFAELIETSESVVVHPVVYAEYLSGIDETRKNGKLLRRQASASLVRWRRLLAERDCVADQRARSASRSSAWAFVSSAASSVRSLTM